LINNRYKIIRKIGAGSLGVVLLVHDMRDDKILCLKLLRDISKDSIEHIKAEFRILSQLDHPNLLKVYDFGVDNKSGPFFTMEYASGGELNLDTKLSPDNFFKVAISICKALNYIHNRQIIHGDLKPSNILISSDGTCKLSDFGFSSIPGKTKQARMSGSALYIAPEILRYEEISAASDIYSLGLLLYEMIHKSPLFKGSTDEIITQKLQGNYRIENLPDNFGGEKMAAIIRKMTATMPSERYQSAELIIGEFEKIGLKSNGAHTSYLGQPTFVGRHDELSWLENYLEKWESGQDTLLCIAGEAGIGKSWLINEFRVRVQLKGMRFFQAYCRENDLRPFSPIIMLLEQLFIELDPEMKRFSEYGPDLKRLFPERFPAAGPLELSETEIKSGRRRLLDNLLRYFSDLSTEFHTLLAIEDIQFADNDTQEFIKLSFGKESAAGTKPIFLICTLQTNPDVKLPSFISGTPDKIIFLSAADSITWDEFLINIFGKGKLSSDFSRQLFEETGGNLLFASEIIKELNEADIIKRIGETWQLQSDWHDRISVPEGVKSIIKRRLGRIRSELKEIVEIGAVIGRSFRPDEIGRIASRKNLVPHDLEELIDAGVLYKLRFGADERYDFTHGQLRRTAYDSINDDLKCVYHRKIAALFEYEEAGPEILGHHYFRAGIYDKAYRCLYDSARNAEKIFAYQKAVEFYNSALTCLDKESSGSNKEQKQFDIYIGLGKALDFLMPSEADKPLECAVELADRSKSQPQKMAEAAIAAGQNCIHVGAHERAIKFFETGLKAAQNIGHLKFQGEAYTGLGFVFDKMGQLEEAEKSYLNALDAYSEIDFPEGSCRVLNYMGIIRKRTGDFNGALDFYRRALEISLNRKFLWSAMNLYGNMGNLYLSRSDFDKGLEYYSKSLEISREISDRRIESINLLNIGHAFNENGNLLEAENHFNEAVIKFRELGDKGSEAITLNNLGLLFYRRGELSNSLRYYHDGLKLAHENNQPRAELANIIGLAEDYLAVASYDEAKENIAKAKELAQSINDTEQMAAVLSISAELEFEMNNLSEAATEVRAFISLGEPIGEPQQVAKMFLIGEVIKITDILNQSFEEALSNPRAEPVITRFKTLSLLETRSLSNPELWIIRLDKAIRQARKYYLPGEVWRLIAIKSKILESAGEKLETNRERERLGNEIRKSLAGLKQEITDNLLNYLGIDEEAGEGEKTNMSKISHDERLEVLVRVARTINTIRNLDPLLNKIMDLALETLAGERGFIMLFSHNKGEKTLEAKVARNLAREDIFSETTISHSSAMEVAFSGKPLLLGRSHNELAARQSVVDFRISSVLCVPLAVKGEILGIVYIDSRSGSTFTQDDLDFLVSFADLAAIAIENASLTEQLSQKNIYLQKQVETTWGFGNIVGRSAAMQKVFRMAESIAETDVTVVITGESGTGKELLARAIHFASPRKKGKFMPVDCGAMAETLLESELFGYVKGAFTGAVSDREGLFEVAEGGSIFLDEISNTSKGFQAKLLRVLQEDEIRRVGDNKIRKIDIRIIAATNKNLEHEVKSGNFREDLYYRLNVVNINLPCLRDRAEDIPLLVSHFLEKICVKMKQPPKTFSAAALEALLTYSWPGNIRQLENICERAVIFTKGSILDLDGLPAEIRTSTESAEKNKLSNSIPKTKTELKAEKTRMERMFLVNLLNITAGNVMEASRISGMDRSQIHHLMSRFGINSSDFKNAD
jgi:Nif-specific regulatory protein